MFSIFWSESHKNAVNGEKQFWRSEWDEFKREVHRASDQMLAYEVKYYEETFSTLNYAKSSFSNLEQAGGSSWVNWLVRRADIESQYVDEELKRRGKIDSLKGCEKPADYMLHSWEVIALSSKIKWAGELRQIWGF